MWDPGLIHGGSRPQTGERGLCLEWLHEGSIVYGAAIKIGDVAYQLDLARTSVIRRNGTNSTQKPQGLAREASRLALSGESNIFCSNSFL